MIDRITEQPFCQTRVITRLFRLQITRTTTSNPEWFEIMGTSETEVQTKYYSMNPGHFIIWTIDSLNEL
jgi:hypothetical protein